jgi:hypothetical protein
LELLQKLLGVKFAHKEMPNLFSGGAFERWPSR